MIFTTFDDLLHHLWFLQVADLFNDSFPDSLECCLQPQRSLWLSEKRARPPLMGWCWIPPLVRCGCCFPPCSFGVVLLFSPPSSFPFGWRRSPASFVYGVLPSSHSFGWCCYPLPPPPSSVWMVFASSLAVVVLPFSSDFLLLFHLGGCVSELDTWNTEGDEPETAPPQQEEVLTNVSSRVPRGSNAQRHGGLPRDAGVREAVFTTFEGPDSVCKGQ